jgi:hypothetical protein
VANGPILAAGVERLQDNQESVFVIGVKQVLQLGQLFNVPGDRIIVAMKAERVRRIAFFEFDLRSGFHDAPLD